MKLKPIYLYGVIFIAAAAVLIIFSKSESPKIITKNNETQEQMPQDDIHKNFDTGQQTPSGSNVNQEVLTKLKEMKKLADAYPVDTLKIREYADFLSAAHKQDEAIKYYEKILSIDSKRKDIYFAITSDYYIQGKLDKAEEVTRQLLKLFPKDPMATYNLGAIEATKGSKEKAREIWMELIKSNPNDETSQLAKSSINEL